MDKLFFTDDHIAIQNMVREFSKTEIEPIANELDANEQFPKKLVEKMGILGLMGMIIPSKYGGAGLDMVSFVTAIIELAKVDASVAITMTAHTSLGSLPLLFSIIFEVNDNTDASPALVIKIFPPLTM